MSDNTLPSGVSVYRSRHGHAPNMGNCRASVRGDRWGRHQCGRAGVVEECGMLWCRQHAPSAVKARTAERDERYDAERRRNSADWNAKSARDSVAATALRYFRQQATHDDLEAAVNAYAAALDAVAALTKKD